ELYPHPHAQRQQLTRRTPHRRPLQNRFWIYRRLEVVLAHVSVSQRKHRVAAREIDFEMNRDGIPEVGRIEVDSSLQLVRLTLEALHGCLGDEHHLVLLPRVDQEFFRAGRTRQAREEPERQEQLNQVSRHSSLSA